MKFQALNAFWRTLTSEAKRQGKDLDKVVAPALGYGSGESMRQWVSKLRDDKSDLERIDRLAKLLGVSPVDLYKELGYLDERQVKTATDDDDTISQIERVHFHAASTPSGVALMQQRIAELGYESSQFTEGLNVGGPRADAFRYMIGVSRPPNLPDSTDWPFPPPSRERREPVRHPADTAELVRAVWRTKFAREMQYGPVLLEDRRDVIDRCQGVARHEVWFWVPQLYRYRAPIRRNALGSSDAVETLVFVGDGQTGADRMAAFAAEEFGWGHVNTSMEAQQVFGRQWEQRAQHSTNCLMIAKAYLNDRSDIAGRDPSREPLGENMVVAHGDQETIPLVIKAVRESKHGAGIRLVYCHASPDLRRYAGQVMRTQHGRNLVNNYQEIRSELDKLQATTDAATQPIEILVDFPQGDKRRHIAERPDAQVSYDLIDVHWRHYRSQVRAKILS